MQLTAVFEHWHLGDGNYPALAVGDEARLSFELDAAAVEPAPPDAPAAVAHLRDAEYAVTARVIRRYDDGAGSTFPVLEAGWFRFYSPTSAAAALPVGSVVHLRGRVALDHYLWVEFRTRYPDPPDLFYGVRVVRVRQVAIPERFVRRDARSVSHPTALAPGEYDLATVRDVSQVAELEDGPAFSLVDLDILPAGAGPARPTFSGADV